MQVTKVVQLSQPELFKDRDFLQQKYVVERLSIKEISALISSSRTAVAKYLNLYGIPLRQVDRANKSRSQLRYGETMRQRQLVAHKRERQAIEKMRALRRQGFSYWKIADVFNSMKVPTKTGRGRWHARAIKAILDANIDVPPS